jgi:serine protease Do
MRFKLVISVLALMIATNLFAVENRLPVLYEELLPSVVTLHTFQNIIQNNRTQVASAPNGLGSGVIISNDGLIVTAAHVVHSVDSLHVEFGNGVRKRAKVISSIPWADLALVQVDDMPDTIHIAELGDSEKVKVGEQVFVIGAPLGLSRTLTVGYISGRHPVGSRPLAPMAEFFQTDTAINPGNSGGPMFNMSGKIIGIASHIQSKSGGSDGLGFTVTSESVKQLLLDRGRFWSGIEIQPLNETLSNLFHLPQSNGVLVQRVANGSHAFKAGIKGGTLQSNIAGLPMMLGGDIILSINGNDFNNKKAIKDIMQSLKDVKPGQIIELTVWRSGKKELLKIHID